MLHISRREFEKGWTRARQTYLAHTAALAQNNAIRLMLFYAVENGLKAIIMRIERIKDGDADFSNEKHDLNKLLARAKANQKLFLKPSITINGDKSPLRSCTVGQINQMWRYGCTAHSPTDSHIENQLNCVVEWIEQQLPTS